MASRDIKLPHEPRNSYNMTNHTNEEYGQARSARVMPPTWSVPYAFRLYEWKGIDTYPSAWDEIYSGCFSNNDHSYEDTRRWLCKVPKYFKKTSRGDVLRSSCCRWSKPFVQHVIFRSGLNEEFKLLCKQQKILSYKSLLPQFPTLLGERWSRLPRSSNVSFLRRQAQVRDYAFHDELLIHCQMVKEEKFYRKLKKQIMHFPNEIKNQITEYIVEKRVKTAYNIINKNKKEMNLYDFNDDIGNKCRIAWELQDLVVDCSLIYHHWQKPPFYFPLFMEPVWWPDMDFADYIVATRGCKASLRAQLQREIKRRRKLRSTSYHYYTTTMQYRESLSRGIIAEQLDMSTSIMEPITQLCNTIMEAGAHLESSSQFPVKKLEGFAFGLITLVQTDNLQTFAPAAMSCIYHLTDKPLLGTLLTTFKNIASQLWEVLSKPTMAEQGTFRDMITNWERMSDSIVLDKLREFMSFCMTFGSLEFFGLSETTASIVYGEFKAVKKHKSVTSFALAFCDVLEFVLSRLGACLEARSLGPLIHSSNAYLEWHDEAAKIIEWNLMLGHDRDVRGFTEQEFQELAEKVIARGEEYSKFAKNTAERKAINAITSKVRIIHGDFVTTELAGKPRLAPFSVLISGNSSIGKTSLIRILASAFAKVRSLPDDSRFHYTRDATDDFMSGFKSYMWMILMDDVATTAPQLLSGIDLSVAELFKYVQNIPLTANMASLEEKGKVAIRPEFVVATSNSPTMNAEHMFTCPGAARRRLPFRITPKVKIPYTRDDCTSLDPSKCIYSESEYPDYWTFEVHEISPLPLRNADGALEKGARETQIQLTSPDLKGLLTWFVPTIIKHFENQERMKSTLDKMGAIEFCEHKLPKYMCDQMHEQIGYIQTAAISTGVSTIVTYIAYRLVKKRVQDMFKITWFNCATNTRGWFYAPANYLYKVYRTLEIKLTNPEAILTLKEWKQVTRERIGEIGANVGQELKRRKGMVVVSLLLGAIAAWKVWHRTQEVVVSEQLKYYTPQPLNEKVQSSWGYSVPDFNKTQLLPQSLSLKDTSLDELSLRLGKSVAHVQFHVEGGTYNANIVFLGGFLTLINTHCLSAIPDICSATLTFDTKLKHLAKNTKFIFNKKQMRVVSQHYDATIFLMEEFGNFPKMTSLFPQSAIQGRFNGRYIYRDQQGEIHYNDVLNCEHEVVTRPLTAGFKTYDTMRSHVIVDTKTGYCGSLLIVDTSSGFFLGGIHSLGGASNRAHTACVYQHMLPAYIPEVGKFDLGETREQIGVNDSKYLVAPISLTPTLRSKDPFNFRDKQGLGEVYGSLGIGTSKMKSRVAKTPMYDYWTRLGYATDHEVPIFDARLWHHALDTTTEPEIHISSSEMAEVSGVLSNFMYDQLTDEDKKMIRVIGVEHAILGVEGVNYMDKINMKTSLGFPSKKNKKSIFKPGHGTFTVASEFVDEVDRLRKTAMQGIRNNPIYSGSPKDETKKQAKVAIGLLRIFYASPTSFNVMMRQFYLPLIRVIQRDPLKFEMAVGVNAHSQQWDKIVNFLLEMSTYITDGDHKNFDQRAWAFIIYFVMVAYNLVIYRCYVESGDYSAEELAGLFKALDICALDVAYAFLDFNGTLLAFLKQHVSGQILTVIVNCGINSSYFRLAYRRCFPDDPSCTHFTKRVRLITYGDDFIVAVHPDYKDKFNFKQIQTAMSTFGVLLTPATKDSSEGASNLEEVEFLKRRFTYHEDLQRWCGPLSKDSISKSLLMHVRSTSITVQEQSLYSLISAHREMFFHGKEIFLQFHEQALQCIKECGLQHLFKSTMLLTYDQLLNIYLSGRAVDIFFDNTGDSHDPGWYGLCEQLFTNLYSVDCHSQQYEINKGSNNEIMLYRVGQPTSVAGESAKGSSSPSATCLQEQMSDFVAFVDEESPELIDYSVPPDPTRTQEDVEHAQFKDYLSRPVVILTKTWDEGTSINETFKPWTLWAQNPSIKAKLENYGLFRGNLHIKMLINASPFFYGMGRLTYEPLVGFFVGNTAYTPVFNNTSNNKLAKSQRRGFEFFPQHNAGGEMILPFMFPRTWCSMYKNTFDSLGECNIFSYCDLSNANNVTTASVTINILAWCENVELSAPTAQLILQAGYEDIGPISGPASAVAKAAKELSKIPVMKPFAMTTEAAANGIGTLAKYFGFTNLPNTEAQKPVKSMTNYGLASTELSTPYEKLSMDEKNELTIDPRIAGLPPKDEMMINEVICRESFLTLATWKATDSSKTALFRSYVLPSLYTTIDDPDGSDFKIHYHTPIGYISRLFGSWRGTIIYRFQVICSPFHKGRLRITWDPFDLQTTITDASLTTSFTRIIDIGETQNIEFEVPYMQACAFQRTLQDVNKDQKLFGTTLSTLSQYQAYANGTISLSVMNVQTAPSTSADIYVAVFVKAGKDFAFAVPIDPPKNITYLKPQMDMGETKDEYIQLESKKPDEDLYKVHMGERIVSFRQMLHRSSYAFTLSSRWTPGVMVIDLERWSLPITPRPYGYMDTSFRGQSIANGISGTANKFPINVSPTTPYTFLAPLYIGSRGSFVYNFHGEVGNEWPSSLCVARETKRNVFKVIAGDENGYFRSEAQRSIDNATVSTQVRRTVLNSQLFSTGAAGRILTSARIQSGIAAQFPYYSDNRFTSPTGFLTSLETTTPLEIPEQELLNAMEIGTSRGGQNYGTGHIDVFYMTGHDFTFLYFNCVPTMFTYTVATSTVQVNT